MHKIDTVWKLILLLWIGLILIDQLTKAWAISALEVGISHSMLGNFLTLQLLFNPGAAFSIGAATPWIFTILALLVVIFMPIFLRQYEKYFPLLMLTLIWAGAAGNLLDRIFRGTQLGRGLVIDFINYNGWFVGNVADIYIVLGVAGFLIWELRQLRSSSQIEQSVDIAGDAGAVDRDSGGMGAVSKGNEKLEQSR